MAGEGRWLAGEFMNLKREREREKRDREIENRERKGDSKGGFLFPFCFFLNQKNYKRN